MGTASDPYQARDKILELEPDVMTLDVEMPRMNGIEFLKRLMPQYPLPVVVVSAVSSNVFDALNAGAVDFVTKPDYKTGKGIESLVNELIIKIKIASTAKVGHLKRDISNEHVSGNLTSAGNKTIIAIGASTGGTEATYNILKMLPRDMPGIVIVQHMPPVFTRMYAERLNNSCLMEVKEAPYQLICLDIMMPNLDGIKTLKAIRDIEKQKGIDNSTRAKVIMTTGLNEKENVYTAFESGCEAFAAKPIDTQKLTEVMKKLELIK